MNNELKKIKLFIKTRGCKSSKFVDYSFFQSFSFTGIGRGIKQTKYGHVRNRVIGRVEVFSVDDGVIFVCFFQVYLVPHVANVPNVSVLIIYNAALFSAMKNRCTLSVRYLENTLHQVAKPILYFADMSVHRDSSFGNRSRESPSINMGRYSVTKEEIRQVLFYSCALCMWFCYVKVHLRAKHFYLFRKIYINYYLKVKTKFKSFNPVNGR